MYLNQDDVLGLIIATFLNPQQRHVSDAQDRVLFKILTLYLYRQLFQVINGLYLQLLKTYEDFAQNFP